MSEKAFEYQVVGYHDEDEWELVDTHCNDHESAALDAANIYFWGDPSDPHRFEETIRVRKRGETAFKAFAMTAEPDVNFYAEEVEP